MIETEKVAELLDRYRSLMETLRGEKLGGFALIVPPEGDPITSVLMAEMADPMTFFSLLKDQLSASIKPQTGYGGVQMPRNMR
jgi:hypothetical protein